MTIDGFMKKWRLAINTYSRDMVRADLEAMLRLDAVQHGGAAVGPFDEVALDVACPRCDASQESYFRIVKPSLAPLQLEDPNDIREY